MLKPSLHRNAGAGGKAQTRGSTGPTVSCCESGDNLKADSNYTCACTYTHTHTLVRGGFVLHMDI